MQKVKYLDMENATLILQLNTIQEYKQFFEKHFDELSDLNFKRIYVRVLSKDLKEILKVLQSVKLPIIIKTDLLKNINLDIPKNLILINTNDNLQISGDNVYNQVILNELNLEKAVKLINKHNNIIIEPEIDVKHIFKINSCLNNLFKRLPNKLINIGNYIVPTNLLKEHPCNCYLCNGWKCHKKISGLPKVIFIDNNYNLYPHAIIGKKLCIGNIKKYNFQNLLKKYLTSREYKTFISCCKCVFTQYLPNYPFQYFPVAEYIREVANEV